MKRREVVCILYIVSAIAMATLTFYIITDPIPRATAGLKFEVDEKRGNPYVPPFVVFFAISFISLANLSFVTFYKMVWKEKFSISIAIGWILPVILLILGLFFVVLCGTGPLLPLLLSLFCIFTFFLIFQSNLKIKKLLMGIFLLISFLGIVFLTILLLPTPRKIAIIEPSILLPLFFWPLFAMALYLKETAKQGWERSASLFVLFFLALGFFFSIIPGQPSIEGVVAYLTFVLSAIFSVLSVSSPSAFKENRGKNFIFFLTFFILAVGVCTSGINIAETTGKTELRLYKASATSSYELPTSNETHQANCALTFLVINYGGSPASGEIKIFGYWNGTYREIASTEKIEGYGHWKGTVILNFSPTKLVLVYNSERVSEKAVYYSSPQECAILYPMLGLVIGICGFRFYRRNTQTSKNLTKRSMKF